MQRALKIFSGFSAKLLPHELDYLLAIHRLEDPEKVCILSLLQEKTHKSSESKALPGDIDRRKYSYMKQWIREKLTTIDVDAYFLWLSDTDRKIMTDSLDPADEKKIIRMIREDKQPQFYFIRFYELIQNYRNYLLIRVRQQYYQITGEFLESQHDLYSRCRDVNLKLHLATHDIVGQYSGKQADNRGWEEWLLQVFYDESLDGLNRYLAVVRLSFLYYNYREYNRLRDVFDHLDTLFRKGMFYSPRILVNYYANRLLLHVRYNEWDTAIHYGYLSIRHPGNDYLYYLTNLAAVLLRREKSSTARKLLTSAFPELKKNISPHTRIGFTAYYIQSLIKTGEADQAASYAHTFLQSDRQEILKQRWHLFFTSYNLALMYTEQYQTIIMLARKFKLPEKDIEAQNMPGYIPNFVWQHELAKYKQLQINRETLLEKLTEAGLPVLHDPHKFYQLRELCIEYKSFDNQVFSWIYDRLFKQGYQNVTPHFFV
jgi:hypothetical protein